MKKYTIKSLAAAIMLMAAMAVPSDSLGQITYKEGRLNIGAECTGSPYGVNINGMGSIHISDSDGLESSSFSMYMPSDGYFCMSGGAYRIGKGAESAVQFYNPNTGVSQVVIASTVRTGYLTKPSTFSAVKAEDCMTAVSRLRPVSYEYIEESKARKKSGVTPAEHYGFVAQDIEDVMPSAVHEAFDGAKTVDQSAMLALLVGAVQDLSRMIEENQIILAAMDCSAEEYCLMEYEYDKSIGELKVFYSIAEGIPCKIQIADSNGFIVASVELDASDSCVRFFNLPRGIYVASLLADVKILSSMSLIVN